MESNGNQLVTLVITVLALTIMVLSAGGFLAANLETGFLEAMTTGLPELPGLMFLISIIALQAFFYYIESRIRNNNRIPQIIAVALLICANLIAAGLVGTNNRVAAGLTMVTTFITQLLISLLATWFGKYRREQSLAKLHKVEEV